MVFANTIDSIFTGEVEGVSFADFPFFAIASLELMNWIHYVISLLFLL